MRFLNSCSVVTAIFLASAIISMVCAQYYLPKAPISISWEDPADEDGTSKFEDDKEHTTHVIDYINPVPVQGRQLHYLETHTSHPLEITVPPPEA